MKYLFLLCLLTLLFAATITAQEQYDNSGKEKINYRRTETNNQPTNYTQQPKEQVFPLGYGTNHLGKITTGTGVWTELNPKVPRVDYIGIDFINPDTGWACGGSGAIIKTTNGGEDWIIAETPVSTLLLKIHSFNGQVVIATGYDGLILRSIDRGENFIEVPSGVGSGTDLWGVQMVNDTLGWICGMNQTLLKTTDAGLTWEQVFPGLNQHYWSLEFLTEQYGFIVCNEGKVLKTTNGGTSWTEIQAGDTRPLYTIDIIDSLHIATAGAGGKNVYSSDGGVTWVTNPDIPVLTATNWIEFVNRDTGYSVQDVYDIRKTTNRGQSWFNPNTTNLGGEWHIELLEDGTGFSGGNDLNIYKRTNGLDNWEKLFLNYDWSDVYFVSEMKGFFISFLHEDVLYKTEDGGINFQKIEDSPRGNDLLFLDSLIGFIAGTHKTTDGGESWYQVNTGGGTKVFFINDSVGWSIDSHIYKTTDQGENWFIQFIGTNNFKSIFFVDTLNGWAASRYVWQTTDGGENWIERMDIPAFLSDDIYFLNVDTGWVAAYNTINPSLFKTTDGGLNWNPISEVVGARKFHYFPNPSHWLINGFGLRYITTDYGNSWINIINDVPPDIKSFQAPTNFLGYAVGSLGLILSYDDTTYIPVELISFIGNRKNKKIILEWITATELNNYGFEIQRLIVNSKWEKIGFVHGRGTATKKSFYSFSDLSDYGGEIKYRLKQIDYDGSYSYSQAITITALSLPSDYYLFQNYPNPFNSTTVIVYQIPEDEFVTVKVYDVLGNEVTTLVEENKKAGYYKLTFSANDLSTGIYFYKLTAGEYNSTKKLILLK